MTVNTYVLRVRMRLARSSRRFAALVDPMNTRLMFVPPEFATSSVSGLFEMNKPHGQRTDRNAGRREALRRSPELCQTFEQVERGIREEDVAARRVDGDVADRSLLRQRVGASVDDERRVERAPRRESPSERSRGSPAPRSPYGPPGRRRTP